MIAMPRIIPPPFADSMRKRESVSNAAALRCALTRSFHVRVSLEPDSALMRESKTALSHGSATVRHPDGMLDQQAWAQRPPCGERPCSTRCCRHPLELRPRRHLAE